MLTSALELEGFNVHGAPDGESGVRAIDHVSADVVVVDLRLPGIDGFEVVRKVRSRSDVPIVILTAHGDSDDVVTGLEAGADDFLAKPIAPRELAARLHAVLRRMAPNHPQSGPHSAAVAVGAITVHPPLREVLAGGEQVWLTRTEFEVLLDLARHSPTTVTRGDLLARVWGYDYLGDSRLVDIQIYRIRQKLAALGCGQQLVTVRGVGFRLLP
jgi:DNA-binding response OmpR family regulator